MGLSVCVRHQFRGHGVGPVQRDVHGEAIYCRVDRLFLHHDDRQCLFSLLHGVASGILACQIRALDVRDFGSAATRYCRSRRVHFSRMPFQSRLSVVVDAR